MKILFFALISVLIIYSGKIYPEKTTLKPFEGIVHIRLEGEGITNSAQMVMKGRKMLVKLDDGLTQGTNAYPLINFETRKITFISYQRKYYFEVSMDLMDQKKNEMKVTLSQTTNKAVLCGYTAAEWVVLERSKGLEIHIWSTSEVKTGNNMLIMMQGMISRGESTSKVFDDIISQGGFPLKIIAMKSGKPYFSWAVTRVEPKEISDKALEVPTDFITLKEYMKKRAENKSKRR